VTDKGQITIAANLGKVYLVGAGPGDPGLLSLKGRDCLAKADVVLYDGLVNPLLLRHTKARAERTCRSMGPGGRVLPQAEINSQLIAAAREGKTVVRLKGGDPFIFGRGSEEAAALAEAGIPFEVVPGITAAVAAGEYAGISLTHRQHASAVAFITGHEDPHKPGSSLDYQNLAAFAGTLVFYMGLHRLPLIVESLLSAGKPAQTPACVISRATTPRQRTVTATLEELPQAVADAGLHAPSLIIVGDCVLQREKISWFEHRPRVGKLIAITRPIHQADAAVAQALDLGAQPVLLPTIEILPPEEWSLVDQALSRLGDFDWLIFTSANGVESLLSRLWSLGRDARCLGHLKLAAIGPATAESLHRFQLRADVVPESFRAEALAEALKPLVKGQRVLWAGANRGRDVLPAELEAAGANVEKLVVYQNRDAGDVPPESRELLEAGEVDWIALSSPSIARNLKSLIGPKAWDHVGRRTRIVSISPVTTAAAREAGLPVHAEAAEYTWPGLFQAILEAEQAEDIPG
jgi:uroporphyrinogen III methyltransferase/synthase